VASNSIAIGRAVRLIEAHNAVIGVTVEPDSGAGDVCVIVNIATELPAQWRSAGQSPSGVKRVEPVTFRFGPGYPVHPPKIRLRADFNRCHPHIQPGAPEDLPNPCLVAGSPQELLRSRSILGLVEQLADWLDKAAMAELIDPKQGWEPVRRDHIEDVLVAEGAWLKGLPHTEAGCFAFKHSYLSISRDGSDSYWIALKKGERVALGPDLTKEFTFRDLEPGRSGNGVALVAWSGKQPDGTLFLADRYMPETVATVEDLLVRADQLGCRASLEPKLTLLQERFLSSKMKVPIPIVIVLLPRRPYPVIGSQSPIEICPYILELRGHDDLSGHSLKVVRPAMHREDISQRLMREASGEKDERPRAPWALIGCGSVGSKLAMHMTRAGRAPASLIDRANMSPHNFARHALYPTASSSKYGLVGAKASLLEDAVSQLGRTPKIHDLDIVSHMTAQRSLGALIDKDCFAVVNTTGSATVRETLGSQNYSGTRPRVVEACLLGLGAAGLMTVEGPRANPSTTDLICEAYFEIHQRPELAEVIFGTAPVEIAVGQGCSALTMPLRDSKLSLFAAAIAERLYRLQNEGPPANAGLLLLGSLGSDGLSQSWMERKIEPRILLQCDGVGVRISPEVDRTIKAECEKRRGSETGGILYGRYCEIGQEFHVVGSLPAPPDSKFSKAEFVLGVEGLKPLLSRLIDGTAGALYPLGTWHNHLMPSGPSAKDTSTSILLSGLQYFPLLMLIHTPTGYVHLTTETVRDLRGPGRDNAKIRA
jgi:Prokaryotic E2 family A